MGAGKKGANLVKNTGLLTIGQFSTKLLNFLLVPLYTFVLSTGEYGSFDLVNTMVGLLIPLLTLNIYDGAGRYSIGSSADRTQVFSVAMKWTAIGTISCLAVSIVGCLAFNVFGLRPYWLYMVLLFAFTTLSSVLTIYIRGLELIRTIAVSGVIGSSAIIGFNLLFLLNLGMGLDGYFLATILGLLVQSIYIIVAGKLWTYFSWSIDKAIEKRMLKYSVPMIANTVSWWVNDLSDRLILTAVCGLEANGIYAVAYKIPAALTMLSSVFSQAWTLSAVRDFDPDDSDSFFSKAHAYYTFLIVISCSVLITLDRPLARLLFSREFFIAWMYVPPLLIAAVFGALSGFIGAFFTAMEDAGSFAQTTVIGAVVNLVLNLAMVPMFGPMGAAVATAISGFSIWIIRIIKIKKSMSISLNVRREFAAFFILVVQSLLLLSYDYSIVLFYSLEALLLMLLLCLFREELRLLRGYFNYGNR